MPIAIPGRREQPSEEEEVGDDVPRRIDIPVPIPPPFIPPPFPPPFPIPFPPPPIPIPLPRPGVPVPFPEEEPVPGEPVAAFDRGGHAHSPVPFLYTPEGIAVDNFGFGGADRDIREYENPEENKRRLTSLPQTQEAKYQPRSLNDWFQKLGRDLILPPIPGLRPNTGQLLEPALRLTLENLWLTDMVSAEEQQVKQFATALRQQKRGGENMESLLSSQSESRADRGKKSFARRATEATVAGLAVTGSAAVAHKAFRNRFTKSPGSAGRGGFTGKSIVTQLGGVVR